MIDEMFGNDKSFENEKSPRSLRSADEKARDRAIF